MNELAQDEALLQDFLTESDELVQRMEQDLLILETSSDPEVLNRVFRAMHTIKGTSSFLGFNDLKELSHQAEDILNALRRTELRVDRNVADLLLLAVDLVKSMLNDIRAHRPVACDLTAWSLRLQRVRQPESHPQPVPAAAAAPPQQQTQAASPDAESTTMRVDLKKLDNLVMLVGELVLERNRILQIQRDAAQRKIEKHDFDSQLAECVAHLSFVTDELQAASLSTRMIPIDAVFKRLPRLVRDLSANLKKDVELVIQGRETEIDRTMVEQIADPLVHLIRNCVDHGLETPEVRTAGGKLSKGTITVDAHAEGDHIIISIADDGRGIDTDRVLKKGIERGLCTAEAAGKLARREILDFIFQAGFSTSEVVTDVSGRGVGMDVVRTNIKRLNGTIDIESTEGIGTTVTLTVPLTMAIMPVLVVEVSSEVYAIPLRTVLEIDRVPRNEIKTVSGMPVFPLRGRTIPLIDLGDALGHRTEHQGDRLRIVVLSVMDKLLALVVDQFLGQESTVIKSMGGYIRDCHNVAGASIGGDGRVRLVLDPAALLAELGDSTGAIS